MNAVSGGVVEDDNVPAGLRQRRNSIKYDSSTPSTENDKKGKQSKANRRTVCNLKLLYIKVNTFETSKSWFKTVFLYFFLLFSFPLIF